MQYVKPDVSTICIGQAASMAAVLLAAGAKRQALRPAQRPDPDPPAAGLRHPGAGDRHRDPRRGTSLRMKERINEIMAQHTGQAIEKIAKDTDRDFILEAEDAKKYGLVDMIYHRRDDIALKAAG